MSTVPAAITSPMQNHRQVDIASKDPAGESIVLSLVETRAWGERGANLIDVQKKIYAYLDFVESGAIWTKFPEMKGKKIIFRLHSAFPPAELEEKFFALARKNYLDPLGISWQTSGLAVDDKKG